MLLICDLGVWNKTMNFLTENLNLTAFLKVIGIKIELEWYLIFWYTNLCK